MTQVIRRIFWFSIPNFEQLAFLFLETWSDKFILLDKEVRHCTLIFTSRNRQKFKGNHIYAWKHLFAPNIIAAVPFTEFEEKWKFHYLQMFQGWHPYSCCHAKHQFNVLFQTHPPTVDISTVAIKNIKQEKCIMSDGPWLTRGTLLGEAEILLVYQRTKME